MDHSLVSLNETHPWQTGPVEVWQNVVHWRREWQISSVVLPWEPHEQYEEYENGMLLSHKT